jgi:hypothetical protein
MSLRDQILAASRKFKPAPVEIPELGGTVYVRPLSIGSVARLQVVQATDPGRASLFMIIESLCDEDGKRVLTADDEAAVLDWPVSVGETLAKAIMTQSGIDGKDAGDAEGN